MSILYTFMYCIGSFVKLPRLISEILPEKIHCSFKMVENEMDGTSAL